MATLKDGDTHSWDKNLYTELKLAWTSSGEGTKTCTVVLNDNEYSYPKPPQSGIRIDKKKGRLTNQTGQTIEYTLTK